MSYLSEIKDALAANSVDCGDSIAEALDAYLTELLRVNEYMNLTAIRDPRDAAVKNIADCVLCARFLPENARLLDVGSGAGLPAFPFAIVRPDVTVTALDSTGKKVNFISDTAKLLGLGNITAVCGRAEELAGKPDYREKFTAVSARAVARMNILSELCLPFLSVGGVFIAMKSRLADEELSEAMSCIRLLGGAKPEVSTFGLLGLPEASERTVITIKKAAHTPPKYPRKYALISSKPL